MKSNLTRKVGVVLCGFALAVAGSHLLAQGFPEKPITLIVPYPAGGSTDVALRAFADTASKVLSMRVPTTVSGLPNRADLIT